MTTQFQSIFKSATIPWLVLLITYITAIAFHHEFSHDEAQAWNIARAANWPWGVLANARQEGHTPFWYLVLWPFSLTGNPEWMLLVSGSLVVAVAALLLVQRPFPLIVCVLIMFGYLQAYDYATISRPYVLAYTLSAVFAVVIRRSGDQLLPLAITCAAMAMSSAFGIVLSVPLMGMALLESFAPGRAATTRRRVVAITLYVLVCLIAAAIVVLPLGTTDFEQAMVSGERATSSGYLLTLNNGRFPTF